MVFYFIGRIVCHTLGHIYPAYASYKALKVSHNEALLTHWLTYWIVIGVFTGVEFVTDTFIFWLPFYNIFKMAFVVWLMLPQTQGSTYIYNTIIRPWLVQHEAEIDQYLHRAETKAKSKSTVWGQRGAETLQRVALNGIALGQTYLVNQPDPTRSTSSATGTIQSSDRIEELSDDADQRPSVSHVSQLRQRRTQTDANANSSGVPPPTVNFEGLAAWASGYIGEGLTRLSATPMSLVTSLHSALIQNGLSNPQDMETQTRRIKDQREKLQALLLQLDESEAQLKARLSNSTAEPLQPVTRPDYAVPETSHTTAPSFPAAEPMAMPTPSTDAAPVVDRAAIPTDSSTFSPSSIPNRCLTTDDYDSSDDLVMLSASIAQFPAENTPNESPPPNSSEAGKNVWLW
ncbi:hypothetical protein H4R33_003282 [Dimargaris cristalligena]|nr:hypothetical protein H4R33_003282 [Dimargaris cristalligena]